jgi:hypothetical protein
VRGGGLEPPTPFGPSTLSVWRSNQLSYPRIMKQVPIDGVEPSFKSYQNFVLTRRRYGHTIFSCLLNYIWVADGIRTRIGQFHRLLQ